MASKGLTWLKRCLVVLGAIGLFFGYAWLPLNAEGVWNSPDETAAAYFSTRIPILGGAYDEPAAYAQELGSLVHPRSMTVVGGNLVPGMWLGLPWVLSLAHGVTGLSIEWLELLIPLAAVLAVLVWQQVVATFFRNAWVGWAAALALAVHPGWWYYTARGLHPNVLFVALGIGAVWMWSVITPIVREKYGERWQGLALYGGGVFMGLSIFVRVNELVWIAPLLLLAAWHTRHEWKRVVWAGAGIATVLCLAGIAQFAVYGAVTANGYQPQIDPLPIEIVTDGPAASSSLLARVGGYVLPFGLHEKTTLTNVFNYHIGFFPFWSAFALLGGFLLVVNFRRLDGALQQKLSRCAPAILIASCYLFVLYGSWNIHDNPDPTAITIGTSYIRYWLPITLAMTPLIGYMIVNAIPKKRSLSYRRVAWSVFVVALVFGGATQTFRAEDEGLLLVQERLVEYGEQRAWLLDRTSDQDIIIVDRSDKVLFPYRGVVVPLRDERTYQTLHLMEEAANRRGAGLYYWGMTFPEDDEQFFREQRLDPLGLEMEALETLSEHTLYSIYTP